MDKILEDLIERERTLTTRLKHLFHEPKDNQGRIEQLYAQIDQPYISKKYQEN